MAEESKMVTPPIVPALPQIESSRDAFAQLHTPAMVVTPLIPSGIPENLPTNIQLQGDAHTGPNPGAQPNNLLKNGTIDYIKAVKNQMADESTVRDRYKYGRTYSYGAGYKNMDFDRFYNHPKFKELGFSPYRDNDALYNEKGSWWDDNRRMIGEWGGLAASGFKSVWGSEVDANQEMEKGMAIGTSTRGGFGGWVTNFGLNTAYTAGIMGEMAVENLALAALEAGTFGAATPVVGEVGVVRNVMNFGKLTKAWNGIYEFTKSLKNVESAKNFWQAAKLGEVAKFVNPFERTTELLTHVAKGSGGIASLSAKAKMARGFGDFYKDIREMNLAHSEARLEGEGAANKYEQQLIDEYYAANGKMAEGKDAQDIHNRAQSVKTSVVMANDLTIYFSNKLVFEDMLSGFRPGKAIAEGFLKGSGRVLERTAPEAFKAGETAAVKATAASTGGKVKDFLLKSQYVPWSKTYFLANLSEGIQESSQEVITQAAMDYHDKIHRDPTQVGFYSSMASIGKGFGNQFSGEGLNTFFSGYLMGSLIQGAQAGVMKGGAKVLQKGKNAYQSATGKPLSEDPAATAKAEAEKADNDILNAANHIAANSLIYGDDKVNMTTAMKLANEEREKADERGDTKTAKDMSDELNITHLQTLARTKNMGLLTGHVDDMLALDNNDLATAYSVTADQVPDVRKKLETLKERAENYQKKYDYQQQKMPNPGAPWMFAGKNKDGSLKHPEAFAAEMLKYNVHEKAMADILFATEDYERIGERMSKIGDNLSGRGNMFQNLINVVRGGKPVPNAAAPDISVLVDHQQRMEYKSDLRTQIGALVLGSAQDKKKAEELQTQYDLLEKLDGRIDNYMSEMASEDKAQRSPEEEQLRKETARVRPGTKVVRKKDGTAFTVVRIEGDRAIVKNEKGELKSIKRRSLATIKDATGGKRLEFEQGEGDTLSESISQLYDTYEEYLRHVAKMKKGYVFDKQLQEAFAQLKDYYALEHSSRKMVNTINILSDPEYMERYKEMLANVEKLKNAKRQENLKAALDKYREMAQTNDFLKELFDLGVFVMPEDVERLKDFTMVDFYDAANKEMVPTNSELYRKILDIVEKYAAIAGARTRGKAIPEAKGETQFNPIFRKKLMGDNRTYADLAKQYGFDPNSASSTVPTEQVLRGIIASKHALSTEKALARRLLTTVKPGRVITFVNNNDTPGVYKPASNETIVDARYNADDYSHGTEGAPIEFVILHEYGHELTVDATYTDKAFSDKLDELSALAQAYQMSPVGKANHGDKPLYAFKNNREFATEALSNAAFQEFLREIPYENAGKVSSAWEEFTNSIKKLFSRLLGLKEESNLLDEVLSIITAKIDAAPATTTATKPTTGITTLSATDLVTTTTPIALIKNYRSDLYNKLIAGYKAYHEDMYDKPVPETDDMIPTTDGFKKYMTESGSAASIINKHNEGVTKVVKTAPAPKKVPAAKTPLVAEVISDDVWSQFVNDGTVDHVILEAMVEKIRAGKNLSERELAIGTFPDITAKINDMLLTKASEATWDYKGIPVVEDLDIKAATGEAGAAKYDRKTKTIKMNPVLLRQKFDEKAWTKSRKQSDGSEATPLPLNMFNTYGEFQAFVIEHEFQHSVIDISQFKQANPGSNVADYENEINRRALEELGLLRTEIQDEETVDIMDQYNDITSKEELEAWKKRALLDVVSSSSMRDAVSEKHGVDFNGDFVKKLIADKEVGLAMSLNFEDLVPGTVVLMKDGRTTKVVQFKDAEKVTLVSAKDYQTNDPTAGKTYVYKGEIKNQIKMKNSEFVDKASQDFPLTDEEKADSIKAVENAVADDATTVAEDNEKAKTISNADANKGLSDSFNDCAT